jgi:putative ABC transport system permease protein
MTNNVFRQENPYAFEYTSFRGNPEDVEEQHIRLIEKTLYEEEIDYRRVSGVIRLQEQADTNDAVEVISVSEFNAFATAAGQETVALGEHEALQLYYANGLISGHNEEPYQLRLAGSASVVEVDVIDARESYLFPVYTQMYVLPDHLIDSLKEPVRKMRYHAFEVDNLPATRQAGKRLSEALPGAEGYTFFATEYDLHKVNQSFGAILFVGFFIGAVFFVAAGSFLYFRLYTDLADDKRKFAAIMKLGLTDGELSSVITKQLAILFLVPIGVATVHGAVALTALQHMFNYSLVKESVIVLGGFVLVQLIYFLLIRFRYIRLVKGA